MELEKTLKRVNPKEDKNNRKSSEEKQLLNDEERKKIKSCGPKIIFCHRNSVLTDLMKVKKRFQAFHNIIFIFVVICVVHFYLATPSEFSTDIGFIINGLSKLSVMFAVWIGLLISCVIVYYVFTWWTLQRIQHKKNNGILDRMLLLIYVIYLVSTFAFAEYYVVKLQVPMTTSLFLQFGQIAITMKIYSFIREKVPRVLKATSHKGKRIEIKSLCPNLQHFVYFLVAPTLLYRDSYPRTSTIRWRYVITNLLEFIASFFTIYCMIDLFPIKAFRIVDGEKFTPSVLVLTMAKSTAVGYIFTFHLFYPLQHCMLNALAEMLRFGDRLFYQDWWNSISPGEFHRKWNLNVNVWMRTYVYMELQEMGWSKKTALRVTFLLSSFVHELFLGFTFGFCLCVFSLLYYVSGVYSEVYFKKAEKTKFWNVFALLKGFFELCFSSLFYSIELFARINCPPTLDKPLDYFVPRFWTCNILSLQ